jgi:hypothetical protein
MRLSQTQVLALESFIERKINHAALRRELYLSGHSAPGLEAPAGSPTLADAAAAVDAARDALTVVD